ncbi:hypothetical protein RJ639_007937 [Escallonia herrerae]|uniref:Reverse transcriptase/retrotransposon-derived protein RNase H-like domain-containing protein n=1 Tax=Escallonia herrerae TaxID=1293975 RepID=A0AA88VNJ9_9ASTE|nr:hypothetical protein RJ639_007937 [Escallonia herrerae]
MDSPLYGFFNHSVDVEGIIALPVAIGTPPTQANLMLDFVVVKVPSAYNAILRRPALNQLQAVDRRGERKPDNSPSVLRDFMLIEEQRSTHYRRSPRRYKDAKGEPVKNLVSIEVYPGDEDKTVQIGSNLKEDTKLELVNLLRTYADVFAWTAANMPGIDHEVITHRLNVDPSKKPVKQKKRTFAPERQEKIEEETSFDELKTYLTSPPLLSKPFPGEDLFLYLSVTEVAVSTVLVMEGDGVQKPIYYVSKVLQDVETRYPKIDRIALALITLARRLNLKAVIHALLEPFIPSIPIKKVADALITSLLHLFCHSPFCPFQYPLQSLDLCKILPLALPSQNETAFQTRSHTSAIKIGTIRSPKVNTREDYKKESHCIHSLSKGTGKGLVSLVLKYFLVPRKNSVNKVLLTNLTIWHPNIIGVKSPSGTKMGSSLTDTFSTICGEWSGGITLVFFGAGGNSALGCFSFLFPLAFCKTPRKPPCGVFPLPLAISAKELACQGSQNPYSKDSILCQTEASLYQNGQRRTRSLNQINEPNKLPPAIGNKLTWGHVVMLEEMKSKRVKRKPVSRSHLLFIYPSFILRSIVGWFLQTRKTSIPAYGKRIFPE